MDYEYQTQDGEGLSDDDLHERYDEMLDDCYGDVNVCEYEYNTSHALREIDPIAYRCGFLDWLDGEITEGTIVEVSA